MAQRRIPSKSSGTKQRRNAMLVATSYVYAAPTTALTKPTNIFTQDVGMKTFGNVSGFTYSNKGVFGSTLQLSATSSEWMDLIGVKIESGQNITKITVDGNVYSGEFAREVSTSLGGLRPTKIYDVYGYGRTVTIHTNGSSPCYASVLQPVTKVSPNGSVIAPRSVTGSFDNMLQT